MSPLARSSLLAPGPARRARAAPRSAEEFPRSFLWGTAVAGFQTEAGGTPSNRDRGSDWWTWSHDRENIAAKRVSGDLPERGPGHWRRWRSDVDLAARQLNSNAFRMSVEWSRIFPRSTRGIETGDSISLRELRRLDRRANRSALRHYAAVIRRARRRGMKVLLTVNHFTLPNWIHDSIASRKALEGRDPDGPLPNFSRPAGWLDRDTVDEFRKYSAYLAWKLGRQVDIWTPINEPLVVATNGYANVPGVIGGYFPPGAFSYTGAITAVVNLERGNAAAYGAIKRWDRRSRVGPRAEPGGLHTGEPGQRGRPPRSRARRLPVQQAVHQRRRARPGGPQRQRSRSSPARSAPGARAAPTSWG